jgi:1-acyl-sn-glycerol-3-phosphate acyltransferase
MRSRPPHMPTNWMPLTRLFAAYSERLVRRQFHKIRLLGAPDRAAMQGRPVVLYANHPSWWDPLIGLLVWRRLFGDRIPWAPIDSVAVEKYAFFKKLGFFGIDRGTSRGAREFLRVSRGLMDDPATLLMLTPQGRFADVREPVLHFAAGLGHLFRHSHGATFLPLAIEYPFWEEQRPEVLFCFGEPLVASESARQLPAHLLTQQLEGRLDDARSRLAEASIRRDAAAFQILAGGRSGINPCYDAWRWLKAACRGQAFTVAHGNK